MTLPDSIEATDYLVVAYDSTSLISDDQLMIASKVGDMLDVHDTNHEEKKHQRK